MNITIANKKLTEKPQTNIEKSIYFKDLTFKTANFNLNVFKEIIENGYTITYIYKDKQFTRENHYMTNNYVGTQFICVDVDKCDITPIEFVDKIEYKPTFIHTTFSNLTEAKDNKYCFHLIYCFNEIIKGEDNFNTIFNILCNDYAEYVDSNAKDCHRVIFTSNKILSNFVFKDYGIVYNVNDFINADEEITFDSLDSFFNEDSDCLKNKSLNKSISSNNLSRNSKNRQTEKKERKSIDNFFNLDEEFFNDLNSLERSEFIDKYSNIYPYITQTEVSRDMFINGYADLRNTNYYIVPSAQYRWNSKEGKAIIDKIQNGHRTTMLWIDAIAFMKIIPNITKEYLVYLLVTEVFRNFMNGDGQLNNWFIVNKAKEVWNNIDMLSINPIKKSFIIDKNYWLLQGYNNWLEVARIIRKQMNDEDFGELYDFSKTVEENVELFKEYGVNTTKKTLIKWLDNNHLNYVTNKQYRDEMVIYFYNEDNKRSSRDIEKLCKENNIKVGKDTILKIISNYKHICQKITET